MSKAELRKNFADMKKTLDELKFPKTFSHCDIHLKNIIYDDESGTIPLQWRHNKRDGVSNHRRLECLLKRLCRRRSNKTSKLRVSGLCEGYPPITGGFP